MRAGPRASAQNGTALLVVILLVATLSFIALAISQRTVLSASRSVNTRARSELLWRALGVEALAMRAIRTAMTATPGKLASSNPLMVKPIEIPMPGGSAEMRVMDRTRCFNVNSLVASSGESGESGQDAREEAAKELADLLAAGRADVVDARRLVAGIVDWIDDNSFQEPGGAEDGYYTALPTPYRTGGQRLADISELRAMAGMDRVQYGAARPFLCAQPSTQPSPINVNMLGPADAPLLVGLARGALSLSEARDLIEARPPGGYETVDQFWSNEKLQGLQAGAVDRDRVKIFSRYLEVDAAIEYGGSSIDLSMLFEVNEDGRARLLSRRIGRFE